MNGVLRRNRGFLLPTGERRTLGHASPLVMFTTVALGGFRGLLADVLWIRAIALQDEQRYFETVQLSDWITKLEPRFPEVWAFHAWNMAYNISVYFPHPEDRWRWVRNGIRLLQEDGIGYNPDSGRLHGELAWLYLHKIGGVWDRDADYFRWRLAQEMGWTVGDVGSREREAEENVWPGRKKYGIEPHRARWVERLAGPLDWRTPEAHALYWALQGRDKAFGDLWCDRLAVLSAADLFRHGLIVPSDEKRLVLRAPDLGRLPYVRRVWRHVAAIEQSGKAVEPIYQNFLRDAAFILLAFNREAEACEVFLELQRGDPEAAESAGVEQFVQADLMEKALRAKSQALAGTIERLEREADGWQAQGRPDVSEGLKRMAGWWRAASARAGEGGVDSAADRLGTLSGHVCASDERCGHQEEQR